MGRKRIMRRMGEEEDSGRGDVTIIYNDCRRGHYVVPVYRTLRWTVNEYVAPSGLEKMLQGEQQRPCNQFSSCFQALRQDIDGIKAPLFSNPPPVLSTASVE